MNNKNNTGYRNTGYRNTGYCNTGNYNTGDCNTGNYNTGDWNTGYRNTGDRNTGDRNTGDCNTGDWNTGDRNTGYFNNTTPEDVLIFGKLYNHQAFIDSIKPNWLFFLVTLWIPEENMTDAEKLKFPTYKTVGGYLKKLDYKEAAKLSWDKASTEDKLLTYKLPNFDAKIAQDIFGIDFQDWINKHNNIKVEVKTSNIDVEVITINGVKYKKM